LNELGGHLLQPHHGAEGREVAANRAREQRAEPVEQPDRDATSNDGEGGQQDEEAKSFVRTRLNQRTVIACATAGWGRFEFIMQED
jgi:hypothetical protein